MSLKTQESRVDALIRLVGIFVLVLGSAMAYFTYSEAAQSTLGPQVIPVFYVIAALLIITGLTALISRFK